VILRLEPPIPLTTPKGKAFAYFLLDYSMDHNLLWICFLRDGGACWTFRNSQIRLEENETMGQRGPSNQHEPAH